MTANEAYSEFKKTYSELTILSCYEYESCFVFYAIAGQTDGDSIENMALDSLYAVQKSDGTLSLFTPFDIPEEEYNSGKEIELNFEPQSNNLYKKKIEAAKAWLDGLSDRLD